jgi:hypothetical protein
VSKTAQDAGNRLGLKQVQPLSTPLDFVGYEQRRANQKAGTVFALLTPSRVPGVQVMNHEMDESTFLPLDEQMTEMSLLLPNWQVDAIAEAARAESITVGQYIRRAVQQALHQFVLPGRAS